MLSDGFTGGTVDNFINSLVDKGINVSKASFMARILANILDKILSCLIVYIAVTKIVFFQKVVNVENNKEKEIEEKEETDDI
ncbi:hypothetical protein [uncultured Brachyspira sp.]|uniref:hypothetical protein n=1 Tax=uncultured Brachyspira sp. TaxID=221953 RepID=UPI00261DBE61|nr:hypothetical protein [uncultured Brachyspira sp.]